MRLFHNVNCLGALLVRYSKVSPYYTYYTQNVLISQKLRRIHWPGEIDQQLSNIYKGSNCLGKIFNLIIVFFLFAFQMTRREGAGNIRNLLHGLVCLLLNKLEDSS